MRNFLVLMITVIGLGLSSAASALLIDASNWGPCLGANNCTIGGATLTSIPRGFRQKTVAGKSGLGINGGATGGEIDIDETITIDFSGANVVDEFQLLFLFNGPEFGDPQEIALITMVPVVGAPMWGTATVTGENTLTLSGFDAGATWANCGATTISGSGCFTISDPFGAMNVATIDFRAVPNTTSRGDSDYSIGFVSAVPEPATIACLGVGLAGLGFTRSRRKRG